MSDELEIDPIDAELFAQNYAEAKAIAARVLAQTNDLADVQKLYREIDPNMDYVLGPLMDRIGIPRDTLDENSGETIPADRAIRDRQLASSDAPANMNTYEKWLRYRQSGEPDRQTLQSVIDRTPSLKGFTLEDAVALAQGGEDEMRTRSKFEEANPNILMAVAYTMLDLNPEELARDHPDFASEHAALETDFGDMAAVNVFYGAVDSDTYTQWEGQKNAKRL